MEDILSTSGYNFEGYRISEYLGFCSGECALGTGFLSSLSAGIADFLGSNSTQYEQKLLKAKSMALSAIKEQAQKQGANAIIGLDIDYVTFSADIMGVVATGTSVKIEKLEKESQEEFRLPGMKSGTVSFPVINFYEEMTIRPFALSFNVRINKAKLSFYAYKDEDLTAINVDLLANTMFGTIYEYLDVNFTDCRRDGEIIETEEVCLEIPLNQLKVIQSVTVRINHYILSGKMYSPGDGYKMADMTAGKLLEFRKSYGEDIVGDFSEDSSHWICMCGCRNELDESKCHMCGRVKGEYTGIINPKLMDLDSLLPQLMKLSDCREIVDYLTEFEKKHNMHFTEECMKEAKKIKEMERTYGNMKDSMISMLEKYLS